MQSGGLASVASPPRNINLTGGNWTGVLHVIGVIYLTIWDAHSTGTAVEPARISRKYYRTDDFSLVAWSCRLFAIPINGRNVTEDLVIHTE